MADPTKTDPSKAGKAQSSLISQTAEYTLRAMAYLTSRPAGVAVRALDLAEATGIPVHYLSKIMRRLVVAQLVAGRKGHGGGFVLAREPDQVTILDILRSIDHEVPPNRCAFGWGDCDPQNPCPLHPIWSQLSAAHQEWASEHTLADLAPWVSPVPDQEKQALGND